MNIDDFVSRLDKVRRVGPGRYIACCPAHADKSPSMNAREVDDGRILIICRAGCSSGEILAAMGLEFSDLFPERLPEQRYRPLKPAFPAADVLAALRNEALIVSVLAANQAHGTKVSMADRERAMVAAERIARAVA